jgi:hypothetical protein
MKQCDRAACAQYSYAYQGTSAKTINKAQAVRHVSSVTATTTVVVVGDNQGAVRCTQHSSNSANTDWPAGCDIQNI